MTSLEAADQWLFRLIYDPDGPVLRALAVGITHLGAKGGIWLLIGLVLALFGRSMTRRTGLETGYGISACKLVLSSFSRSQS